MQAILHFAMDEGDQIPRGRHGGRLHVRYRLEDGPRPVASAEITEAFAVIEDPYGVGRSIERGSFRTDIRGVFDDYVAFSYAHTLPDDFRLVADQQISANGVLAASNRVIWSVSSVLVTATDGRRPRQVIAQVSRR